MRRPLAERFEEHVRRETEGCWRWLGPKANYEQTWCESIVMLLPANRTEQRWWQESVEPYRREGTITSRFLAGRLRFDVPQGTYSDPRGNRPPFGCVLLIWATPVLASAGKEGA